MVSFKKLWHEVVRSTRKNRHPSRRGTTFSSQSPQNSKSCLGKCCSGDDIHWEEQGCAPELSAYYATGTDRSSTGAIEPKRGESETSCTDQLSGSLRALLPSPSRDLDDVDVYTDRAGRSGHLSDASEEGLRMPLVKSMDPVHTCEVQGIVRREGSARTAGDICKTATPAAAPDTCFDPAVFHLCASHDQNTPQEGSRKERNANSIDGSGSHRRRYVENWLQDSSRQLHVVRPQYEVLAQAHTQDDDGDNDRGGVQPRGMEARADTIPGLPKTMDVSSFATCEVSLHATSTSCSGPGVQVCRKIANEVAEGSSQGVVTTSSTSLAHHSSGSHQAMRKVLSNPPPCPFSGNRAQRSDSFKPQSKTIAVAMHCPQDLKATQWSFNNFMLVRKIYEGSMSMVMQAVHKATGRTVAIKMYRRNRLSDMERFQLAREITIHTRLLHPFIVSLYAAWKDAKYVYLAMEWAPAGNLLDLLVERRGKLAEEEAVKKVIRPLISALAYLHAQGLIHRDIKLENILVDRDQHLKLADFGLAINTRQEIANTRLGTFGYFAPEVLHCPLKKTPADYKHRMDLAYGPKVDVWSAGVVAFELLTATSPFQGASPSQMVEAIQYAELHYPEHLSHDARDFLSQMLQRDESQRATAKQLLAHPFIEQHTRRGTA